MERGEEAMDTRPDFRDFAESFLDELFEFRPPLAVEMGLHEYDGRLPDYSPESIERRCAALQAAEARLSEFDPQTLPPQDAQDYTLIQLAINQELFNWTELQYHLSNPLFYASAIDVSNYIKRDYAPLPQRAAAVARHLRGIPTLLEAARTNLKPPLAAPFIETALEVYGGTVAFLERELPLALKELEDATLLAELEEARDLAVAALRAFVAWLKEEQARAHHDFAIGPEKFRKMLRYGEMVDWSLDKLLAVGEEDLARNEEALRATAAQLDPHRPPAEVMGSLGAEHPPAERLIVAAREMLEDIRHFIIERDIIEIPEDVGCKVEETPAFLRWAMAMMDSPGPLERVFTPSFYYITPVEEEWSEEKKEEWLSKFDPYTLRMISIHEVFPGHYVHSLHNRRAPTRVSKVLGAYSFWEGWAHYTEQMMLDEGYGEGDLKLRLAQLAEALVRDCRYVVAIKMHTQGMTVEEATRFFMEHAFMERLPSYKEAVRGTFDPGYGNYTLGKLMLLKLRADYRAERGAEFTLRSFHDHFLSFGAPPIPFVRRRLLQRDTGEIL